MIKIDKAFLASCIFKRTEGRFLGVAFPSPRQEGESSNKYDLFYYDLDDLYGPPLHCEYYNRANVTRGFRNMSKS